MAVEIYKRGQGRYTRSVTFGAGSVIGLLFARYLYGLLTGTGLSYYWQYGIPVALFVAAVGLMFWIVNRPGNADFMIATEGEMKKVSWSSRREIIGGTKVVIATTLLLAVVLWAVDLAFAMFFKQIGVLQVGS